MWDAPNSLDKMRFSQKLPHLRPATAVKSLTTSVIQPLDCKISGRYTCYATHKRCDGCRGRCRPQAANVIMCGHLAGYFSRSQKLPPQAGQTSSRKYGRWSLLCIPYPCITGTNDLFESVMAESNCFWGSDGLSGSGSNSWRGFTCLVCQTRKCEEKWTIRLLSRATMAIPYF